MHIPGTAFERPQSPAAKCLHLVRLNPIITRSELIEATGLSQPTITRATAALLKAGLLQERTELTQSRGRGRPTVPLDIADNDWMLAGISIGTTATYIALYDIRGRLIREDDIQSPVAKLETEDFIEHIMASINRLSAGIGKRLVSVGVTTSGHVDERGLAYAPNLGWDGMDVAAHLNFQFGVPVTVTSAVPAILGSETQAAGLHHTSSVLVLFADDSLGAALSDATGVHSLDLPHLDGASPTETLVTAAIEKRIAAGEDRRAVLDDRAHQLGRLTAQLAAQHGVDTVVIAGGAFYDDPAAPKLFAQAANAAREEIAAKEGNPRPQPQLRMIPNHSEIVRAIARAAALDPLLRAPLELGR